MINPLEKQLNQKLSQGKKIFCAFFTLGYHSMKQTEELIVSCDKLGVDVVELGIPFSDPLADGPVIQASSEYVLNKGVRIKQAFDLVRRLRKRGVKVPIIFFSYFNIIYRMGVKKFVQEIKQAGFEGVLCPDLPPEENNVMEQELKRKGLAQIYLIAPTTNKNRLKQILKKSSGFVYYVSRTGVTGKKTEMSQSIGKKVKEIKAYTKLPVLVGFGVSKPEQIKKLIQSSDGVIVGSSLISAVKNSGQKNGSVKKYLKQLVNVCH